MSRPDLGLIGDCAKFMAVALGDQSICKMVDELRIHRFHLPPEKFERMLWLLVGNSLCAGAKSVITEMMERK